MSSYDNFSYDKCTFSKADMPAFEKVDLSYEKLSYVKLARVNDLTSKLDNFFSTADISRYIFLIMVVSSLIWTHQVTIDDRRVISDNIILSFCNLAEIFLFVVHLKYFW